MEKILSLSGLALALSIVAVILNVTGNILLRENNRQSTFNHYLCENFNSINLMIRFIKKWRKEYKLKRIVEGILKTDPKVLMEYDKLEVLFDKYMEYTFGRKDSM
jgi:hypothetical protein